MTRRLIATFVAGACALGAGTFTVLHVHGGDSAPAAPIHAQLAGSAVQSAATNPAPGGSLFQQWSSGTAATAAGGSAPASPAVEPAEATDAAETSEPAETPEAAQAPETADQPDATDAPEAAQAPEAPEAP